MSSEQSCSALVEDELDVEELVVALWRNKLGAKVSRLCDGESYISTYCTVPGTIILLCCTVTGVDGCGAQIVFRVERISTSINCSTVCTHCGHRRHGSINQSVKVVILYYCMISIGRSK